MQKGHSKVIEQYLQAIYSLQTKDSPIKSVQIARCLNVSPSTVHATLTRMRRDKLVLINKKKEIQFTPKGFKKAEQLIRRHRLIEVFLWKKLKISWDEVHQQADIMEHGLTPLIEEKLAEHLNHPKTCPHGMPIPGEESSLPADMTSLLNIDQGNKIEIVLIDKSLEGSIEVMKFLQKKKIVPGYQHQIIEKIDITKTMTLKSDQELSILTFDIADKIGVVKALPN